MKKRTLLFTLVAGMCYIAFSSYDNGAAGGGQNRTGAKASTSNCSSGGCHSGGTGVVTPVIRVDTFGGVEVNQYAAGVTYTVTVTGAHTSLSTFGFQYAAVSGTGSSQIQAGTFGTPLPAQVKKTTLSSVQFIEHSSPISGSLSKSFTWTAPTTGVGDITMYLTVNAVNGTGSTAGDISGNISKVLTQLATPSAVAEVTNNINVKAYPNPATDVLNLQLGNIHGSYTVQAFDITGRSVLNNTFNSNLSGTATISTANWAPGMYNVVVASTTGRATIQIVKQ